jgi:hypothetical protein
MASNVNDLTVQYEEDGVVLVKEIDKVILSKGAWATLLFRYQQWDNKLADYGPDKYTIRRYQKVSGDFMPKSKFNISSSAQAEKIVDTLQGWLKK